MEFGFDRASVLRWYGQLPAQDRPAFTTAFISSLDLNGRLAMRNALPTGQKDIIPALPTDILITILTYATPVLDWFGSSLYRPESNLSLVSRAWRTTLQSYELNSFLTHPWYKDEYREAPLLCERQGKSYEVVVQKRFEAMLRFQNGTPASRMTVPISEGIRAGHMVSPRYHQGVVAFCSYYRRTVTIYDLQKSKVTEHQTGEFGEIEDLDLTDRYCFLRAADCLWAVDLVTSKAQCTRLPIQPPRQWGLACDGQFAMIRLGTKFELLKERTSPGQGHVTSALFIWDVDTGVVSTQEHTYSIGCKTAFKEEPGVSYPTHGPPFGRKFPDLNIDKEGPRFFLDARSNSWLVHSSTGCRNCHPEFAGDEWILTRKQLSECRCGHPELQKDNADGRKACNLHREGLLIPVPSSQDEQRSEAQHIIRHRFKNGHDRRSPFGACRNCRLSQPGTKVFFGKNGKLLFSGHSFLAAPLNGSNHVCNACRKHSDYALKQDEVDGKKLICKGISYDVGPRVSKSQVDDDISENDSFHIGMDVRSVSRPDEGRGIWPIRKSELGSYTHKNFAGNCIIFGDSQFVVVFAEHRQIAQMHVLSFDPDVTLDAKCFNQVSTLDSQPTKAIP